MSTTTIRIPPDTHRRLSDLARAQGRPLTRVLEDAVDLLERRSLLEAINEGYARVRSRSALDREQSELDGTLSDGLEPEVWSDDDRAAG